jgi:hypothetical protein
MPINHIKTSAIADGDDANLIRPSDWNSAHAYTLQDAVSLSGNTAGVLANISSGTLYLAGGNNITLSQDANSVTVSGPAAPVVFQYPAFIPSSAVFSSYYSGSTSQGAGGNSTLSGYTFSIYLIPAPIDCAVAYSAALHPVSFNTAAATGSATFIWTCGIYSHNNGTLSKFDDWFGGMLFSQNSLTAQTWSIFTFSTAGATTGNNSGFAGLSTESIRSSQGNVSAVLTGPKYLHIPTGGTTTASAGNYWFALANCIVTTVSAQTGLSWGQSNAWTSSMMGEFGAASNTGSRSASLMRPHGVISTTYTSASDAASFFAFPNSIDFTDVSSQATSNHRYHWFLLRNL